MMQHKHTPELRERRHYDPSVITSDAWVCAECEQLLEVCAETITATRDNDTHTAYARMTRSTP